MHVTFAREADMWVSIAPSLFMFSCYWASDHTGPYLAGTEPCPALTTDARTLEKALLGFCAPQQRRIRFESTVNATELVARVGVENDAKMEAKVTLMVEHGTPTREGSMARAHVRLALLAKALEWQLSQQATTALGAQLADTIAALPLYRSPHSSLAWSEPQRVTDQPNSGALTIDQAAIAFAPWIASAFSPMERTIMAHFPARFFLVSDRTPALAYPPCITTTFARCTDSNALAANNPPVLHYVAHIRSVSGLTARCIDMNPIASLTGAMRMIVLMQARQDQEGFPPAHEPQHHDSDDNDENAVSSEDDDLEANQPGSAFTTRVRPLSKRRRLTRVARQQQQQQHHEPESPLHLDSPSLPAAARLAQRLAQRPKPSRTVSTPVLLLRGASSSSSSSTLSGQPTPASHAAMPSSFTRAPPATTLFGNLSPIHGPSFRTLDAPTAAPVVPPLARGAFPPRANLPFTPAPRPHMSLPLADFQTPVSAASTLVSSSSTMLASPPAAAAAAAASARSQTVSVERIADLMSDMRIHINYAHMAYDESRTRVLAFGLPDELVPDFEHDLYSAVGQRRLEEARAQVENLDDMLHGDELGAHSAAGAAAGAEGAEGADGAEDDAAAGGGNTWSPGWE